MVSIRVKPLGRCIADPLGGASDDSNLSDGLVHVNPLVNSSLEFDVYEQANLACRSFAGTLKAFSGAGIKQVH